MIYALRCINTDDVSLYCDDIPSLCLPLSAPALQAIARLCDDMYKDIRKNAKKRSVSADNLTVVRWAPAILS